MARPKLPAGKVRLPRSEQVFTRERLEGRLRPVCGNLVLLQAPAGYGKTLALVAHPGVQRRVWFNADSTDADPAVLANRLAALLELEVDLPAAAPASELAARLAAATGPEPVTIDIDGFEKLGPARSACALLTELLDLASDRVALRIASRRRPRLSLERLELDGRLTDLGPEHLAFDADETRLFVEDVAGVPSDGYDLDSLEGRLGGWPAAVALWTSIRGGDSGFPGDGTKARRLQHYIEEEVLAPAPPEVIELLGLGIALDVLEPSAIAEQTGWPGAAAALELMLEERFFVAPAVRGYELQPALRAHLAARSGVLIQNETPPASSGPDPGPARPVLPEVRIRSMGRFEVSVGGVTMTERSWRPAGALRLLQMLLSATGYSVTADEAAEALWPGYRRDSAVNSFNVALHALRRRLQPGLTRAAQSHFVVRESQRYRLCIENLHVDCEHFLALVRAAVGPDATPEAMDMAVAAYEGDFLADVLYEDFPNERREHLKVAYLEALERVAVAQAALGTEDRELAAYRRLLEIDPLREDIWTRVVTYHLKRGEPAAAVRAYQRCQSALKQALGVTPGRELERLMDQVRAWEAEASTADLGPNREVTDERSPVTAG